MVTVVADAAPSVGLGHLSRCSAVAGALQEFGVATRCLAHAAPEPVLRDGVQWMPWAAATLDDPVVLLDSYLLDPADVAPHAALALFYDGGPLPERADLVIAPIASTGGAPGRHLTGLEHACLRRDFWRPAPRPVPAQVERVLVTTGGGPTGDDLAATLATAAVRATPDVAVTVVRGTSSRLAAPPGVRVLGPQPSLRPLLLETDLVLAAAGQTALEAAACATPALLVALDDFQAEQGARLVQAGTARLVGAGEVARAIGDLDHMTRAAMAVAGPAAVDGRGALRVATAVAALSERRGAGA